MGPFKDSIYATMPQGKIVNIDLETDVKHNEKDTDKKRNIITLNLFNYVKLHLTVVYYLTLVLFWRIIIYLYKSKLFVRRY